MENTILLTLLLLTIAQLSTFFLLMSMSKDRKRQEKFIFDDIEYLSNLISEDLKEQQKVIEVCKALMGGMNKKDNEIKVKNLILKGMDGKLKSSLSKKA